MTSLEVFFTPAEFATLPNCDLTNTSCVVFDVLRATSTMITALGNGAQAILPVEEISEALAVRRHRPEVLLAGERDGVRIGPELADGATFDLGNSPREFSGSVVKGKTIVMTTTNGTRALNACRRAAETFAASFLNLGATAMKLSRSHDARILVVCSGTMEQAALEDVLGAGALCDLLWDQHQDARMADSAYMARELYRKSREDLLGVVSHSQNARRLLSSSELRADVAFCLQSDTQPLVATLGKDGLVRRL